MIPVYFATNRNQQGPDDDPKFGDRFHVDGPQFYRVGRAEVSATGAAGDDAYRVDTVSLFRDDAGQLGSTQAFARLRDAMIEDRRDALIYLHGFASDFSTCLQRAAQLSDAWTIAPADGGPPASPHVFAFSWPSNGKTVPAWEYFSDRDDAEASGKAMARAVLRLRDFLARVRPCGQRTHLVAHSMGNFALRWMVQGIRGLVGDDALKPFFDTIILAAADEDDDALERDDKLGLLPQIGRRLYVYHAGNDYALQISDVTKHNPARLGVHGPRTFSFLNTRITAIDCGQVSATELAHGRHQYYRLRPEVIRDVRMVLAGNVPEALIPGRHTIEPGRRYALMPDRASDPNSD